MVTAACEGREAGWLFATSTTRLSLARRGLRVEN
jgi:hypothetical protein